MNICFSTFFHINSLSSSLFFLVPDFEIKHTLFPGKIRATLSLMFVTQTFLNLFRTVTAYISSKWSCELRKKYCFQNHIQNTPILYAHTDRISYQTYACHTKKYEKFRVLKIVFHSNLFWNSMHKNLRFI